MLKIFIKIVRYPCSIFVWILRDMISSEPKSDQFGHLTLESEMIYEFSWIFIIVDAISRDYES